MDENRDTTSILSRKEVAETLGVTTATLDNWRRANKGPAWHKFGNRIAYRRADVESWARANRPPSPERAAIIELALMHSKASGIEKLVLISIAVEGRDVSLSELAFYANATEARVKKAISSLEEMGELAVTSGGGGESRFEITVQRRSR